MSNSRLLNEIIKETTIAPLIAPLVRQSPLAPSLNLKVRQSSEISINTRSLMASRVFRTSSIP
jgi:hypothetical protein